MSGSTCLYRRSSGIYAIRLVVPSRLRSILGRGEIHASTGLRDMNAAKLAGSRILLHWRERFMELATQDDTYNDPLLAGDGLISIVEGARAVGVTTGLLLGELLNDRAPIYAFGKNWKGWHVPDLNEIDRDHDGTFVWNDVEDKGTLQSHSGPLRCHDSRAAIGGLLEAETFAESLFVFPGNAAFFVDPAQTIPLLVSMTTKSAVDQVRARLAGRVAPPREDPAQSPGGAGSNDSAAYDPITAKHGKKRFSDLVALHRKSRTWGAAQEKRMATEAGLFRELMDDPLLSGIDVETILEYGQRLAKLPSDIYQSRRKFGIERLVDLMAIAEVRGMPTKGETTVKRHVGTVSEILNFGMKHGMLRFNPASDYKRGKSTAGKRDQDQRKVFTPVELNRIFSQSWFVDGTGEFSETGKTIWRPHYYWLPLLALHTGARLNELSQLYLDDVVQAENDPSVWYLDFNLVGADKLDMDAGDKSLKTVNSIRIVPLNNTIIALGLLEYVATLRKSGYTRLFPELKRDRVKGYGKPAGSWFNERFLGKRLGMKRNGEKTFHSFRHVFLDTVSHIEPPIAERVMNQLAGHERGKGQGMNRYAKDRDALALKPIIDQLNFPSVAGIGKFKSLSALKGIESALRYKEAVRRSSGK
jgi:integrase